MQVKKQLLALTYVHRRKLSLICAIFKLYNPFRDVHHKMRITCMLNARNIFKLSSLTANVLFSFTLAEPVLVETGTPFICPFSPWRQSICSFLICLTCYLILVGLTIVFFSRFAWPTWWECLGQKQCLIQPRWRSMFVSRWPRGLKLTRMPMLPENSRRSSKERRKSARLRRTLALGSMSLCTSKLSRFAFVLYSLKFNNP